MLRHWTLCLSRLCWLCSLLVTRCSWRQGRDETVESGKPSCLKRPTWWDVKEVTPKVAGQLKKEVGSGKKGAAHNSTVNIIRFKMGKRITSRLPGPFNMAPSRGRPWTHRPSESTSPEVPCHMPDPALATWGTVPGADTTKGKQATHWAAQLDSLLSKDTQPRVAMPMARQERGVSCNRESISSDQAPFSLVKEG